MSERKWRFTKEANEALNKLKQHHFNLIRLGLITSENAKDAFIEAIAQMTNSGRGLEIDDRSYLAVRCRDCGRSTAVTKQDDRGERATWICRCNLSKDRAIFVDEVGVDGTYLLDQHAIVNKSTDTSVNRKEAIESGATPAELAEHFGG